MFEEGQLPDTCVFTETWFESDNVPDLHGYSCNHTVRDMGIGYIKWS